MLPVHPPIDWEFQESTEKTVKLSRIFWFPVWGPMCGQWTGDQGPITSAFSRDVPFEELVECV